MCINNGIKQCNDCRFFKISLWWRKYGSYEIYNLGRFSRKGWLSKHRKAFRGNSICTEWVHAKNHFNVLENQVGDASVTAGAVFGHTNIVENLQGAIDGELHEIEQMYPVYLETAKFQEENDAKRSFHYALEAEKIHAKLFKEAQDKAKEGKDIGDDTIYICPICGFTEIGANVDKCPVCGVKRDMFKEF